MGNNHKDSAQIIEINTDSKRIPEPGDNIYLARNNVITNLVEHDTPLVSLVVLGYNNLEKYTKTCVECILKYTKKTNYELILVDNGSSDGTFEFFESIEHPKKKVIKITNNLGVFFGANAGIKVAKGRFIVGISNDIFVTQNWLENLLKCALSDDRIGMVVPVSDNVSNLQSVDLNFADFDDMQNKAAEFNVSDPRKWHERLRLTPSMTLYNRVCMDMIGMTDYGFFHDFGDDDVTFRVRRAGYKAILCKDVFVRHAGIATRDPEVFRKSLEKGRTTFQDKYYGIDAWDDVNNFESTMMSLVKAKQKFSESFPNILGVDVLCGTPLLEIKNTLRQQGVFNTRLSAFSTKAKYWLDLKTVCDGKVEVDRVDYIMEYFGHERFDYIIVGHYLNTYAYPYVFLEHLLQLLDNDGQLLIKIKNSYDIGTLLNIIGINISVDNYNIHHNSIKELNRQLDTHGYMIKDIIIEQHTFNNEIRDLLKNINFSDKNAYHKATAKEYIINIVKN
ncbi:glycosyltransferase family 2 protein [Desulfosporosinus shakirovi]|uniref:glycosyltransferase family 2 protein n=1 Tax=Desulfosporosinus shakirovi TaxID=2885154 RepID=UPI001E485629|nr:glycosyltransferase family 2 protein [Desulfosporosinus sp. SRJS8]MCB8814160.1 glycosyltransferase family 2 protein [Desulfosporosinus sp. SRJS8]